MNEPSFYLGKPIRSLQTMLRVIAAADPTLPSIVPDGIYGPDTEAAVRAFQRRYALPQTGAADPQTWNKVVDVFAATEALVLPLSPLHIRWQPHQSITPGQNNLHLFPIQAMFSALFHRFSNFLPISVTGIHDPPSVAAVQRFQQLCGLPQTGAIDQLTWRCLCGLYALASGDGDLPAAAAAAD